MKVAVCISGHMRNVEKAFPNIYQNVILPNEADVFIHSWYDEEKLEFDGIGRMRNLNLPENIHLKTLDLYKPKKYSFEKPKDFSKSYKSITEVNEPWVKAIQDMNPIMNPEQAKLHGIKTVKSMWYSIMKCNELKELYAEENSITYDFVIKTRFDLDIHDPFIVKELKPNCFYYMNMNHPDEMVCDWLNAASGKIMNILAAMFYQYDYYNTYEFLPKSARKHASFRTTDWSIWGNEYYIRDLFHHFNIPCVALPIRIGIVY